MGTRNEASPPGSLKISISGGKEGVCRRAPPVVRNKFRKTEVALQAQQTSPRRVTPREELSSSRGNSFQHRKLLIG